MRTDDHPRAKALDCGGVCQDVTDRSSNGRVWCGAGDCVSPALTGEHGCVREAATLSRPGLLLETGPEYLTFSGTPEVQHKPYPGKPPGHRVVAGALRDILARSRCVRINCRLSSRTEKVNNREWRELLEVVPAGLYN